MFATQDAAAEVMVSHPEAGATLLGRLRAAPEDPHLWEQFVDRYGSALHCWCRGWGLQQADAEDVMQNVLLSMTRRMRDFCYDPKRSFRAYLKAAARHQWQLNAARHRKAVRAGGGDSFSQQVAGIAAPEAPIQRLEQEFDCQLLKTAAENLRGRIDRRTWDAFYLTAVQGHSGAQVARHLDMEIGTVFVSRSRVTRMLRDEIARMEQKRSR